MNENTIPCRPYNDRASTKFFIPQNSSTTIGADKGQLEVENASDTDDEQVDYRDRGHHEEEEEAIEIGAACSREEQWAVNVMGRGRR